MKLEKGDIVRYIGKHPSIKGLLFSVKGFWGSGEMREHLAIKYFDTYPEEQKVFDTKEEALEFVDSQNKKMANRHLTNWEYREEVEE